MMPNNKTFGHLLKLLSENYSFKQAQQYMKRNKLTRTYHQATTGIKKQIRTRDGLICNYCGQLPTKTDTPRSFVVEHIVSSIVGAPSLPYNLTMACFKCNASKRSIWIPKNIELLASINDKWAAFILLHAEKDCR